MLAGRWPSLLLSIDLPELTCESSTAETAVIGFGEGLFHGNGFGEVAGLVDVAAAADGDVVGEELQGDDFEDGEEQFGGLGDVDGVFD